MTYETWTHEDLEFGDTDDKGWVFEDEWFETLSDLADSYAPVYNRQWLNWSDSNPSDRSWLISDDEVDMRSGDRTIYHLFIEREDGQPLSREEFQEIGRALGVR